MSRDASGKQVRSLVTTQHRGWIRTTIWCAVLGYASVCATMVLSGEVGFDLLLRQEFFVFLTTLAALVIERRGNALLAGAIALAAVWAELHVTFMFYDGRSSASTVAAVWVVAVGSLLGGRAGLLAGAVTAVTAPLAYQAGGWLGVTGGLHAADTSFHVTASVATLAAGAMVAALQASIRTAFRRLERDGQRSRALLDALPVGVIAASPDGEVIACNPTAQTVLDDARTLRGLHVSELPLRRDGEPLDALEPGVTELEVAGRDGAVLEATVLPWARPDDRERAAGDEDDRLLLVLRDVTDERAARAREDELHRQLDHSQRMEAIGLLAGGVAHDFNNLLTVIGGNAALLTESDDPDVFEPARDMLIAQQQGAALARQLLTFARKDVIMPRSLDLAAEVTRSLPLLRRLVGEQVSIDVALDPSWARLDPGQLEQVLFNLCANARDAMAPDGGRLFISSVEDGDRTVLEVRDTGAGMTDEVRQHLFEPFFTTKGAEGTGLGLATVHGIVERSKGIIEVVSAPGEGTLFRIAWPATAPEVETARPLPRALSASGSGGEVLLVEDNERARRALARLLEHAGYSVVQASRADRALALLVKRESPPSIVVTDLQMPGMSGLELADRLGKSHPRLPVVLMSGYIDDALRIEAESKHAEILFKPFHGDVLVARIERELARAGESMRHAAAT